MKVNFCCTTPSTTLRNESSPKVLTDSNTDSSNFLLNYHQANKVLLRLVRLNPVTTLAKIEVERKMCEIFYRRRADNSSRVSEMRDIKIIKVFIVSRARDCGAKVFVASCRHLLQYNHAKNAR